MMIGGITGWLDEGFSLATEAKGESTGFPGSRKGIS
jgi:hypothetical protein